MDEFLLIFEEAGGPQLSLHSTLDEVNEEISQIVEDCWDLDDSVSDKERGSIFRVYSLCNPLAFKEGLVK